MAKIFIPAWDEGFVRSLRDIGLGVPSAPHWIIARLALAKSLQMAQFPEDELQKPLSADRAYSIHMEQLTGQNSSSMEDLTDAVRLLLSIYHDEDLFGQPDRFIELLQRHIQRGLSELRASWRENSDFYDYLYQELFFERSSPSLIVSQDDNERLRRALGEIGVSAEIEGAQSGPRLTRYSLRLASSSDLNRLERELDKIPFELGMDQPASLSSLKGERRIALDVPRPQDEWHPVSAALVIDAAKHAKGALPICPGTDVLGQPLTFDLADAPHLFVAGTTGSGKSVCLHALIVSLLASERAIKLVLIDPKEVEFSVYMGCRHLWHPRGVITEMADAAESLAELVEEMDVRQKELARLGVTNLAEAQTKGSDLPRIVVVIDELADLLMQRPESEESLVRLAQKARAVGIHLVLATQRPGADTFPGLLRSNIPSRIGLSVRTGQESRIILDEMGAEKLLMRGDMLIRIAGQATLRAHGARIEQGDIRPLL